MGEWLRRIPCFVEPWTLESHTLGGYAIEFGENPTIRTTAVKVEQPVGCEHAIGVASLCSRKGFRISVSKTGIPLVS